jgi:hypothetical protein
MRDQLSWIFFLLWNHFRQTHYLSGKRRDAKEQPYKKKKDCKLQIANRKLQIAEKREWAVGGGRWAVGGGRWAVRNRKRFCSFIHDSAFAFTLAPSL